MMTTTYEVKRMAAFDQFPYTHHLEGGVYWSQKVQSLQFHWRDGDQSREEVRA